MTIPGFTAEGSLGRARRHYVGLSAGEEQTIGEAPAGLVVQQGNTCHVVKNWIYDNTCEGDCPDRGDCVGTQWQLKFWPGYFFEHDGIPPQFPRDYEPTDCGCRLATPQIGPAPGTAPPPKPPEPPGGDWFWVLWVMLGGFIWEPDPPWEPPGGHDLPKHKLEGPGEGFVPPPVWWW